MRTMKTFLAVSLLAFYSFQLKAQANFTEEVAQIVEQSSSKGLEEPVIFIGSSSIRMWKTWQEDFPDFAILNHGFGGSEYSDLLYFKEELIGEFEPRMIGV